MFSISYFNYGILSHIARKSHLICIKICSTQTFHSMLYLMNVKTIAEWQGWAKIQAVT